MNGEASPTYFFDPKAPARVKAVTPNAKLIVIFRDPVDRYFSGSIRS